MRACSLNTPLNPAELQLMFTAVGGKPMSHDTKAWSAVAAAYDQLVSVELKKPNPPNVRTAGRALVFGVQRVCLPVCLTWASPILTSLSTL